MLLYLQYDEIRAGGTVVKFRILMPQSYVQFREPRRRSPQEMRITGVQWRGTQTRAAVSRSLLRPSVRYGKRATIARTFLIFLP